MISLKQISIQNIRCLSDTQITFEHPCTLIQGQNGSGKSSILEAIYYLSHGRSFRTHLALPLLKLGADYWVIRAECQHLEQSVTLAVQKNKGKKAMVKLNQTVHPSLSALSEYLPTLLLDTDSHRAYAAGPKYRRQLMNWGLYYTHAQYAHHWQETKKILMQRNQALRLGQDEQHWRQLLIEKATQLDQMRRQYLDDFIPILKEYWDRLLGNQGTLSVEYFPGWVDDYATHLHNALEQDRLSGLTHAGPHRADLKLKVQERWVHHYLSQGQQKVLGYAMAIAHIQLLFQTTGQRTLLLMDDLTAELDVHFRKNILSLLKTLPSQLIITGIHAQDSDLFQQTLQAHTYSLT